MSEELKTEFIFELTTPFEYASGGDTPEAKMITLIAPTSKHVEQCAPLSQAWLRACKGHQQEQKLSPDELKKAKEAVEDDDDVVTGDLIMQMIGMSSDVELAKVIRDASKLFVSGVAQVDGEVKLSRNLLEQMSYRDLVNMTGDYIANFMQASS